MKYGIVIKLLMVACVSIVQLTGCSSDTEELEKSVSGIPIRIVAEMNGGTGISQMTKASVRSSGEWKENYIGAEEYEKTVKHVLLFAFGEFYQFNLSSCIRQQNSLTAQFVSFSLSNLANIFYPPNFYNN